MDVTELCELSSEINGAKIVFSSDDFFGVAENLIKETEPNIDKMEVVCKPPDAWLTKRKQLNFSNFVIIELAARAEIYFISIDTASLVGNVALEFSVQATKLFTIDNGIYQDRSYTANRFARFNNSMNIYRLHSERWPHLILSQPLNPGYSSLNKKFFMISTGQDYTHLRLNIFPDGGITRLRVYGKVLKPTRMLSQNRPTDLISKIYGSNCIAYSSYCNNSHPNNLIKPKKGTTKEDGWCTVRSLTRFTAGFPRRFHCVFKFDQIVGEEWVIFQLGYSGKILSIMLDTSYCEGDSPFIVQVQGLREGIIINDRTDINDKPWQNIVPFTLVNEGSNQLFTSENQNMKMAYVKLLIKPDGCVSRFRVLGEID